MKKLLYIVSIFSLSMSIYGQDKNLENFRSDFEKKILTHFENNRWSTRQISLDTLYKSGIHKSDFFISLSDNLISFDTTQIVLKNPYFSQKYDEADDEKEYVKNFPKSFSVLYQNTLISLFENGKFSCFKIDNFERDLKLENLLNTKKFKYHWIINNQLGALSGSTIYLWDGQRWIKSKTPFPLKNEPKLFEDDEFIVYRDCFGEWGGTIYFYEKKTGKTFFTESTCANTVIKNKDAYEVLAELGHEEGSSEIKIIANPRKLSLTKPNQIHKRTKNGAALGYTDKSNAYDTKLDLYKIQIFSSFYYKNQQLYIANISGLSFIADVNDNNIKIVHPLFFNNLHPHDPITTKYGDSILINLNEDSLVKRETSLLIIKENQILKIDWNKQQPL